MLRHVVLPVAFLVGWSLTTGCGGDRGGGGGGPTAPPPPVTRGITFTPDGPASASSFSLRTGSGTGGDLLEIEIVATDVPPVRDVDFVLLYPLDLLVFESLVPGGFLGAANVILTPGSGSLEIQTSRTEAGASTGSGIHLVVQFRGAANGEGRLDVFDPEVLDGDGLVVEGLTWIGGAVDVHL